MQKFLRIGTRSSLKNTEIMKKDNQELLQTQTTSTSDGNTEAQVTQNEQNSITTVQEEKTPQAEKQKKPARTQPAAKSSIADMKLLLKLKEDDINLMSLQQVKDAMTELMKHENFAEIVHLMQMLLNRFETLVEEYEQQRNIDAFKYIDDNTLSHTDDETRTIIKQIEDIKRNYLAAYKEFKKELEVQKQKNYEQKLAIIEKLKELSEQPITDEIWAVYRDLMQQWKQIGPVPQKHSADIYNLFNLYVEKILDNLKISQELKELDQKKNLEAKIEICEKIEALLFEESIDEAFEKLKELQNEWRSIGHVPRDKRDEINARFHTAIEKLKEKRDATYKQYKEQLERNFEIKKALLVQMKEVVEQPYQTHKDWAAATEKVQEIFNIWKKTGPVPKIYSEKIWSEFRKYLTQFNEEKKAFYDQQQQVLLENYNKKISLCVQAEALQDSTDWQKATEALTALQKEWKNIGPVPKRYSEIIWNRFRKACDTFFQRKKEYFENQDKNKEKNLEAKRALIEEMKNYQYSENKEENLEAIRQFQRRFFEIGPVPIKEKDNILREYKQAIEQLLSKLQISQAEKKNLFVDQQYEQMAQTEQGKEKLRQELFKITNKIRKLETDLNLWENNIEFFAKSKNAEVVIREFKQKIEHARAELTLLKEKQKMLKDLLS